jgi:uncharacterized protein DUF3486
MAKNKRISSAVPRLTSPPVPLSINGEGESGGEVNCREANGAKIRGGRGKTSLARPWSKIETLPPKIREEFEQRLRQNGFRGHRELAEWLGRYGVAITKQGIHQYGQKFERRLDAVRLATEQAREVCAQFKDDDVSMQAALMRLVQTQLFQVLVAVNERTPGRKKDGRGGGKDGKPSINLGVLARAVAGLVRAQAEHRRWAERAREKVAVAGKKIDEACAQGLSENGADKIRSVLMEIDP